MASDNETETCKQVESPGVNGKPEDVSKEDAWAGSSKLGFGFSCMRGEKIDRRRAAHDLRLQMKDLQFRLRELGTTGGSDSDESIFAKPLGVRQRKTKAGYEKPSTTLLPRGETLFHLPPINILEIFKDFSSTTRKYSKTFHQQPENIQLLFINNPKIFKDFFACKIVLPANHQYSGNIQRLSGQQQPAAAISSSN